MIVVAVEYLNTLPFIYGINSELTSRAQGELLLSPPAKCAELAINGECDVALVPVGALKDLAKAQPQYKVITNYCLSATAEVRTVSLLSNYALSEIHTIYTDSHSRSSVRLARLLCEQLWNIRPNFADGLPSPDNLGQGEAIVAIGDKVFELESKFTYNLDLATEWYKRHHLPFVFAVWVALTPKGLEAEESLNRAFKFGTDSIELALDQDDPLRPSKLHYLTQLIEFDLSEQKLEAMQLFLNQI